MNRPRKFLLDRDSHPRADCERFFAEERTNYTWPRLFNSEAVTVPQPTSQVMIMKTTSYYLNAEELLSMLADGTRLGQSGRGKQGKDQT